MMTFSNLKITFFLLAAGLLLASCEVLFFEEELADEARNNFEYLWQQCDENYSFFEYKNVNWDSVYDAYSPRVANGMSADSLFRVLWNMLNELRDGHVNLISPFNVSRFDIDLLGPDNIDFRLIRENYLSDRYYTNLPLIHDFLAGGQIAYFRIGSFATPLSDGDVQIALSRYRNTKGMILDIRGNGGGNLSSVFTLMNRLSRQKMKVYDSYIKSGPGREDFSGPQEAILEPPSRGLRYPKPVMVLTDRGTFSAASFLAVMARELPQMTLIGDTTGGGLGIPNGGQLPNGWTYRMSISRTITTDGQNFENGVPPDIRVILNDDLTKLGIDNVLERAMAEIL
ncbi:MAG: S41 family peptidase [Saprospiraceae bacterium]|nr:S41 family peptidase [Saprospiraceae bacterium]